MNALVWKLAGGAGLAALLLVAGMDWRSAREARAEYRVAVKAAEICDEALAADDVLNWRTYCRAAVRDQAIELHAARANLDDARVQLDGAEQRCIAAVSRAEARATFSAERTARAKEAIASAPRDDAGLIVCDAECLRRIAGLEAGPRG